MPAAARPSGINLLAEVTCPNCWERFPPEAALAIAGHGELRGDRGDPMLAETELRRFLPTRFTPECAALDEFDTPSFDLACPQCHLLVPRVLFERQDTVFLSIFGAVHSGKSYFLAAMAQQMEVALPQRFGLGVTEPHPASNAVIRGYKDTLFNSPNPEAFVSIPNTPTTGSTHYMQVRRAGQDGETRLYPRPQFFQVAPTGQHPNVAKPLQHARTVCLYDNSGEHFMPQHASPSRPETDHLCRSSAMLFVFDPTREPAFRDLCRGRSKDPQLEESEKEKTLTSQAVILATADANVKKRLGREIADPLETPLVVITGKFDVWRHLVDGDLPAFDSADEGHPASVRRFRAAVVEQVSAKMRELLVRLCPAVVAAAERFSRRVLYVPVSATGCSPSICGSDLSKNPPFPVYKFSRGSLRPIWVEVPLLWVLDQVTTGLVPTGRPKAASG
jgi:hypothetical protein